MSGDDLQKRVAVLEYRVEALALIGSIQLLNRLGAGAQEKQLREVAQRIIGEGDVPPDLNAVWDRLAELEAELRGKEGGEVMV